MDETNETENSSKDNVSATEKETEDSILSKVASVEEYLERENEILLDYERQMFLELIHSDGLIICAKGISYDQALINFLRVYADSGNLIIVINSSDIEEEFYKSKLDKKYVHEVANTAAERERIYLEGGIHFISTRILVVDLLKNRVPVELITGIVVLRAHTVIESCQEAFLIRLYREKNKTGFIKAFSSCAEAFTIGYSNAERTMRNLFVKELFVWPRFHATIQSSLKPYEPKVIEFHVPMTKKMTQIQSNILDIMNSLIKEIKQINGLLNLEEITVENCVTNNFHKILQAQLDCIWHQLNSQTRLIVSDLKVLRHIMFSLIYNDSVSAYALLKQYRTTEYALSNSGWVLLDAADQLFKLSKERVYNSNDEFSPESCPKWKALSEILHVEIPNDVKANKNQYNKVKVLILCQDSKTCFQLNQYLTQCEEQYLLYTAMKHGVTISKLSKKYRNVKGDSNAAEKGEDVQQPTEDDVLRESYVLTTSQAIHQLSKSLTNSDSGSQETAEKSYFEPFPDMENMDMTSIVNAANQPLIYIRTFKTAKEGSLSLSNILQVIQPQYVVMYHCNVTAIRQLEVYEARQNRSSGFRTKVFFLLYARTVEEQSYLTTLRREKQAFEMLIETKRKMFIPQFHCDEANETLAALKDDNVGVEGNNANTRQAGGQKSSSTASAKIIVDMREFRSDLPCLIHKRGIQVVPVTISVGDYIITPEICVERKSISDLIGSLNSGRLYNQCLQMQRYYPKPFLLIEFDQNKPFHLQNKYVLSSGSSLSNADILEKLQLLTVHFPKLRLVWSPSPYATTQLFEELKQEKEQPDPSIAVQIGSDESEPKDIENFNCNIYDFIMRLPGVTSKNVGKIMRQGGSLKKLLTKSQDELSELLDSQINAKLFWNALHGTHKPEKSEDTIAKGSNYKFKRGKNRKNQK